jgi:hypothetical protein
MYSKMTHAYQRFRSSSLQKTIDSRGRSLELPELGASAFSSLSARVHSVTGKRMDLRQDPI